MPLRGLFCTFDRFSDPTLPVIILRDFNIVSEERDSIILTVVLLRALRFLPTIDLLDRGGIPHGTAVTNYNKIG